MLGRRRTPRPWSAIPRWMREYDDGHRTTRLELHQVERFFPAAVVCWDHCDGIAWPSSYFVMRKVFHPFLLVEYPDVSSRFRDERFRLMTARDWPWQTDLVAHHGRTPSTALRWTCEGKWSPWWVTAAPVAIAPAG